MIAFTLLIGTAVVAGIGAGLAAYNAIRPLPLPDDYETPYGRLTEEQMHDFIRRYP